jgi:hypothetical protein
MRTIRPVYTGPWRTGMLVGLGDYRRRIDVAVDHAIAGITGKAMLPRPTDLAPFQASLAGGPIDERRDNADGSGLKSGLKRLHNIPCKIPCKILCKILCKPVTPALRTSNHTVSRYHMVSRLADTIAVVDDFWHSGKAASDGASLNQAFLPHLSSEDFR